MLSSPCQSTRVQLAPAASASSSSAPIAPTSIAPSLSTAREACSVAWVRPIGVGAPRRDFGHSIAANASGEVLIAARLERLDLGVADERETSGDTKSDQTVDLTTGKLIKLAPAGGPVWSLPLANSSRLCAPVVALDDAGAAYVVGPYAPAQGELRGAREVALTKLAPDGTVEWSRSLLSVPLRQGRPSVPVVRVAAFPAGGACVTWIGERHRWPTIRAVRFAPDGTIAWEHSWPVPSGARDPHVSVDASGAVVVWGIFQGAIFFAPWARTDSPAEARYLARLEADGKVGWAQTLPWGGKIPVSIALTREGMIGLATVTQAAGKSPSSSELALARLDKGGGLLKGVRVPCEPRTGLFSLCMAPAGSNAFAIGGYFSGGLSLGRSVLRSLPPASEAVWVGGMGAGGELCARAFQGTESQAGLSVHGGPDGAVLFASWLSGSMELGEHKIASPPASALLFLAKLNPY